MARALADDLPKALRVKLPRSDGTTATASVESEASAKLKFGAKSEFVRSLDRAIPAADVVALAEQRGMKLTTGLVYNIRSMESVRGNRTARHRNGLPRAEGTEAVLRAAIAEVGLAKAREILEEVEDAFAGQ